MIAAADTQFEKEIAMRSSRSLRIVLGLAAAASLVAPGQAQSGKGETQDYWITGPDLNPTHAAIQWRFYAGEYYGPASPPGQVAARVNLPAGAVITQIACHVSNDNPSSGGPIMFVTKSNYDESTNTLLAPDYLWTQSAPPASGATTMTTPPDFQHVIQDRDGSVVSYYTLYATFDGPDIRVRGCRLSWRKAAKGGGV